ncbi:IclR family transcriptional regulator domain-containing protein [Ramlibacter sp.]|jgi:IclR family pca regulon transcriptional regulator|uniref:IclR family transcriptional regulator domain-containing protein n=1 Tax=Ramlibacter sp. TaxID=1917967 RepID=UPI002FCB0E93|nr:transcriptional regulator, IclR family-like protein [Ramlibacter sp.]
MRQISPAPLVASPQPHDKNIVVALKKGLEILTCFGREASRLTPSEVARRTGSTPASARRALHTLLASGYLESDGKRYWMAARTLLIAHAYFTSRPTAQLAQPVMEALAERTKESSSLGKLLDDDVIILSRSITRSTLATGLGIGARLPAYCSSLGRVLLAGMPRDEAARKLQGMDRIPLTPRTTYDLDELLVLLDKCREQGWASSDEELELGVRSIAVPVTDRSGRTIAGLSISVHADRMRFSEFRAQMLPHLRRAGESLSARLPPD